MAKAFSQVEASSLTIFTRAQHGGCQCWDKRPEQVGEVEAPWCGEFADEGLAGEGFKEGPAGEGWRLRPGRRRLATKAWSEKALTKA